jgi:hypothetical protein
LQLIKNFYFTLLMYFFYIFSKIYFLNFNFIDIFARLQLNDNYLNLYSFFWTSFWYLPIFFFLLSWFAVLYKTNIPKILNYIWFMPCLAYAYNASSHFVDNHQFLFFNYNRASFNFFLLNNINKYHPFLFYSSVWLSFTLLITYRSVANKNSRVFNKEIFFFIFEIAILLLFICNALSLLLGSWWALQEGTWGGWWNWDASEVFGLLFLLLALVFIHYYNSIKTLIKGLHFISIFLIFNLLIYCFIQLNFDLVSHNFGIKFFFFFNNNFFFIEAILLGILIFMLKIKKYLLIFNKFLNVRRTLFQKKNPINVYVFFTVLVFLIFSVKYIYVSLGFLINFFIWNFLSISVVNKDYFILSEVFFFFFILIAIRKYPVYLYFYIAAVCLFYNLPHIFVFLPTLLSYFQLLHFFVINFMLTNLLALYSNLSFWAFLRPFYLSICNYQLSSSSAIFICDGGFVDYTSLFCNHSILVQNNWNTLFLLSFFHNNGFTFLNNANLCSNLINLTNSFYTSFIYIETVFLNNLLFFAFMVFIIIWHYSRAPHCIFY